MEIIKREYKVYEFDELSEEAQQKALEKLFDINVQHEWWDWITDDAAQVGVDIQEFDHYIQSIGGRFTKSHLEVADAILKEHGEECDTFKLASEFKRAVSALDEDEDHEEIDKLEKEFKRAVLEEYLSVLRKEFDYQTSRECLVESIKANDFMFLESGEVLIYFPIK